MPGVKSDKVSDAFLSTGPSFEPWLGEIEKTEYLSMCPTSASSSAESPVMLIEFSFALNVIVEFFGSRGTETRISSQHPISGSSHM